MKKFILILAVLMLAAPAMAQDVVDVCAVPAGGDAVEITYTVVSGQLPRAFALDITVTDGNIISVDGFFSGECDDVNRGYGIFPASFNRVINADFNNWDDVNYTPVADVNDLPGDTQGGEGTGGVTIEMGSLYVDNNSPPTEGVLCVIHVSASTDVNLWPNVGRGEVVLEDGSAPDLYLYGCSVDVGPTECLKDTDPGYATWVTFGKPDCWCYKKQCRGDTNGTSAFGKPVSSTDLDLFKLAFGKTNTELLAITNGICADLNHTSAFGKQVSSTDLDIFKLYFGVAEASVPECDSTHINFWTN